MNDLYIGILRKMNEFREDGRQAKLSSRKVIRLEELKSHYEID